MEYETDKNSKNEEQLRELIKQAGNDARERKKKAMEIHFQKIEEVIIDAVAKK